MNLPSSHACCFNLISSSEISKVLGDRAAKVAAGKAAEIPDKKKVGQKSTTLSPETEAILEQRRLKVEESELSAASVAAEGEEVVVASAQDEVQAKDEPVPLSPPASPIRSAKKITSPPASPSKKKGWFGGLFSKKEGAGEEEVDEEGGDKADSALTGAAVVAAGAAVATGVAVAATKTGEDDVVSEEVVEEVVMEEPVVQKKGEARESESESGECEESSEGSSEGSSELSSEGSYEESSEGSSEASSVELGTEEQGTRDLPQQDVPALTVARSSEPSVDALQIKELLAQQERRIQEMEAQLTAKLEAEQQRRIQEMEAEVAAKLEADQQQRILDLEAQFAADLAAVKLQQEEQQHQLEEAQAREAAAKLEQEEQQLRLQEAQARDAAAIIAAAQATVALKAAPQTEEDRGIDLEAGKTEDNVVKNDEPVRPSVEIPSEDDGQQEQPEISRDIELAEEVDEPQGQQGQPEMSRDILLGEEVDQPQGQQGQPEISRDIELAEEVDQPQVSRDVDQPGIYEVPGPREAQEDREPDIEASNLFSMSLWPPTSDKPEPAFSAKAERSIEPMYLAQDAPDVERGDGVVDDAPSVQLQEKKARAAEIAPVAVAMGSGDRSVPAPEAPKRSTVKTSRDLPATDPDAKPGIPCYRLWLVIVLG